MNDNRDQMGTCQACGRVFRVKADGRLRHHGGARRSEWPYGREYRCPGSGHRPVERP